MVFYKSWLQLGIKKIKDIYDSRHKIFYTFERLKQIYNISNSEFLNYFTITQSIPKTWKHIIKTQNINEILKPPLIYQVKKCKSPNKMLYNKQIELINHDNEINPHLKTLLSHKNPEESPQEKKPKTTLE